MNPKILIINTGNTSTKVGIYEGYRSVTEHTIRHSDSELAEFADINSQKVFREQLVLHWLEENRISLNQIAAIGARGGILRPMESGTYLVNQKMLTDLVEARRGSHASHLAAQIGHALGVRTGIKCYIVDPITVDEFNDIARISGHALFEREVKTHALNMKAVAKRFCRQKERKYQDLKLIVAHLGTGVSLSLHSNGKMVDAMDPSQEGAFSLDRAGGLPILTVARHIIENNLSYAEFSRLVFGSGGVFSYLKTKDFRKVSESYKNSSPEAIRVVEAMAYQIAKEVGALATVESGKIDFILLTGGMAHADFFVNLISQKISFIAPVEIFPGEDEIQALAEGVMRVLSEEEDAKTY